MISQKTSTLMGKLKLEKDARIYAEEILATVREPLVVLDIDLRVIVVNKAFYEIFKVTPQETIGKYIYNLGNRQWNIPKLRQLLEKILPKKASLEDFEVEHNFETIGRKIMLLNARQIPRPPEKPKIILLTIEDITERRKIEQQLDRAILASIGDAVMACDKDGRIILFNQVACQISGFSLKEALGRHYNKILRFVDEDTDKPIGDLVKKVMDEKKIIKMPSRAMIVRKDNTKIPIADSAAPLFDKFGNISGCVVAFRDITRERQVQELKDEFLNIAAHELRTPMTAVKGFLDMVVKEQTGKIPTAKMKEYLRMAYEGNERMIKLVDNLLNVSRIEA